MMGMLNVLLSGLRFLPLIVAVAAGAYGWHLFDRRQAMTEAAAEATAAERGRWEKLVAAEAAKRDAERREAQAKIDKAQADYWQAKTTAAEAIAARDDLERAIAENEADNAKADRADCGPAIPRRLRDAIDAAGH